MRANMHTEIAVNYFNKFIEVEEKYVHFYTQTINTF